MGRTLTESPTLHDTPQDIALPASLDAAPGLNALMVQAPAHIPLTSAQQRFNALLARIDVLSAQLQRLQTWSDRHRHAHLQSLHILVQQAQAQRKKLLLGLHERLQTADLTAQQQRMARGQVRRLIEQLGPTADAHVQALATAYVSEEDTQEAAQEQADAAQHLREKIEQALGQPIDKPGQYQTPEAMMAAGMRQWQRQQEADAQRKAAKRAARKAQKKKAASEKGEVPPALLREADAQSAIRTVFRQLASALHPDREPDEQARVRKTALMSEANAAYEKNDLSTLLRLHMQVSQLGTPSTARMADTQLMAMALLLKEQVVALEDDLDQLQNRLSRELCVPVRADADEALLAQQLQGILADQRHSVDRLTDDWHRIQNDAELKRWLKAQWQEAKQQALQSADF